MSRVFDEALRLPAEARAALAGEPLASLDGESEDPDREAAWTKEIRQRLDAYERGEVKTRPAAEVLSELHSLAHGKIP